MYLLAYTNLVDSAMDVPSLTADSHLLPMATSTSNRELALVTPSTCPSFASGIPETCIERSPPDYNVSPNSFCPAGSVLCTGYNLEWEFADGDWLTLEPENALMCGLLQCEVVGASDIVTVHIQEIAKRTAYSFEVRFSAGTEYAITAINLVADNETNFCTWEEPVVDTDILLTPFNTSNILSDLGHIDLCVTQCPEPSSVPSLAPSETPSSRTMTPPTLALIAEDYFDCPIAAPGIQQETCVEQTADFDVFDNSVVCPSNSIVCAGGDNEWELFYDYIWAQARESLNSICGTIQCRVVGTNDIINIEFNEIDESASYTFEIVESFGTTASYAITAVNMVSQNASNSCTWDDPVLVTDTLYSPLNVTSNTPGRLDFICKAASLS